MSVQESHSKALPPPAVVNCTVGQVLKGAVKYTLITVLTVGISQVIAIFGLVGLGIKAIADEYNYAKYMNLRDLHRADPIKFAEYQSKTEIYRQKFKNNTLCAKALGLSLISLSLNYGAGYIGKSFGIAIADIALAIVGPNKLRGNFHPESGKKNLSAGQEAYSTRIRQLLTDRCDAHHFALPVSNGTRTLDALWMPCWRPFSHILGGLPGRMMNPSDRPTCILFHGNGMTWPNLAEQAEWLRARDFNVLLVTRGGYPGSSPQFPTTELSSYQDAEAAFQHVKTTLGGEYPNNRIVAYGHSMGSTDASFIANRHSGVHLVTDVALSRIADCIRNVLINNFGWLFSENAATAAGDYLAQNVFPAGLTDGVVTTNSLNNRARMPAITGSYFAMWGSEDPLMVHFGTQISGTEQLRDAFRTKQDEALDLEVERRRHVPGAPTLPAVPRSRRYEILSYRGGHNEQFDDKVFGFNRLHLHLAAVGLIAPGFRAPVPGANSMEYRHWVESA